MCETVLYQKKKAFVSINSRSVVKDAKVKVKFFSVLNFFVHCFTKLSCYTSDDDDASSTRKKSAETNKSAKTLQERAAARHSAKMEKAGR